jgi:thiol-disulfide isomerase/thioredoxin
MVSLQAAFAAMLLSSAGQTVMLDFYADWCAPCRAMEPTVRALQEKGYPVQKVNIDQNPALAQQYGVRSVPCFVMLVEGREVDRVMESTSFSRLERMFKNASSLQRPNPPPQRQIDPNVIPASFQPPAGAAPLSMPPGTNMPSAGSPPDDRLIAASVRLRIEDANGNSCGSGTIIDARAGEALILTCGHIFRDSQGKGKIDVDLFGPCAGQRVEGRLVSFDLTRDVGLVTIRTPGPLTAVRLAPPCCKVQKGDRVASVGCDNGKDPAVRHSYVTSLNRYTGPPNIQVAGQPTEGRSGGGLFSADGMLIGVCNARDPQDQEGYYAAIDTICAQLDQAKLAFVYQSPQGYEGVNGASPMPSGVKQPAAPSGVSAAALNPSEQAAMDEIRRRLKEGAEVVCVIRSRRDPQAKSEVIMLDKASPEFIEQLAAESKYQEGRQETSLETPRPRQPALEWSAGPNAWRQGH